MGEEQQRRVEEAAEKFAEAITESFQAVVDRSVAAQQLNAELTQSFFNGVIRNLHGRTDGNLAMMEELIGQQQRQWEAAEAMAQQSVSVYMDFINSMFSYYQGTTEQVQHQAGQGSR